MKKSFILMFALVLTMGLFTSCSSSDDNTPKEVTGTWNTVQTVVDETTGQTTSSPINLVWEAPDTIKIMGFMDIKTTINLAQGLGGKFLEKVLQSVTFADNGDISAIYSSTIPSISDLGSTDFVSNWTNSGTGLISYDGGLNGALNLKLNAANITAKNPAIGTLIKQYPQLATVFDKSYPAKYRISGNKLTVYLDKAFLDEFIVPVIAAYAPTIKDDDMGGMGATIKPMLCNVKYWAAVTTKFEIGINFTKATTAK